MSEIVAAVYCVMRPFLRIVLVLVLAAAGFAARAQTITFMPGSDTNVADISADGRMLAEGLENGDIRLWRLPNLELVREIPGEASRVEQLEFAANASLLVTRHQANVLEIWEVATGARLFREEGARVVGPFTVDAKRALVLLGQGEIIRLPVAGTAIEGPLPFSKPFGGGSATLATALDGEAGLLYVGTSTGGIRVWRYDPQDPGRIALLRETQIGTGNTWIRRLVLVDGGRQLVVRSFDRERDLTTIDVYDSGRLEKLRTLCDSISCKAGDFQVRGGRVLVNHEVDSFRDIRIARVIDVWEPGGWKRQHTIANHGDFGGIAVGGDFVATWGQTGMRIIGPLGDAIALRAAFSLVPRTIILSPVKGRTIVGGMGDDLLAYDASFRQVLTIRPSRPSGTPADAFLFYDNGVWSRDANIVYLIGDGALVAYDVTKNDGTLWRTALDRKSDGASPRGRLAIDSAKGRIYAWQDDLVTEVDAKSGRRVAASNRSPCAEGRVWLEKPMGSDLSDPNTCALYALVEKLTTAHRGSGTDVPDWSWAASEDHRLLVSKDRNKNGPIRVWDTATGRELGRFAERGTDAVSPVILGRYVVTRNRRDKTLEMWDWQTGTKARTLQADATITAHTAFDGRVIAATHDGRLHVWDAESGEKLHTVAPNLAHFKLPTWVTSHDVPQP